MRHRRVLFRSASTLKLSYYFAHPPTFPGLRKAHLVLVRSSHVEPVVHEGLVHLVVEVTGFCNGTKSNAGLDHLGWTLAEITDSVWDGLTGSYRSLWNAAGQPDANYHRPWLNAWAPEA